MACSPSLSLPSVLSGASVTDLPHNSLGSSHLGLNQQTYERLKTCLSLNLRRQLFIGVWDDLRLRDRLAMQLQAEFSQVAADASSFADAAGSRSDARFSSRVEPQALRRAI